MCQVPERRRTRRVAVRVVRRPWVVHERPLAGRGWSADGRSVGFGAPPWHTQPDILAARDDLQELAFFLVLLICGFHISLKDLSLPLLIMSVVPVCLSRRAARARRGGQVIGRRVMGRRVTAPSDRRRADRRSAAADLEGVRSATVGVGGRPSCGEEGGRQVRVVRVALHRGSRAGTVASLGGLGKAAYGGRGPRSVRGRSERGRRARRAKCRVDRRKKKCV